MGKLTASELAALRELCDKASVREISVEEPIKSLGDEQKWTWVRPITGTSGRMLIADAAYLVAAWNALPRLLDDLEAERRTSISYKDEMGWAHKTLDSMRADLATAQARVKRLRAFAEEIAGDDGYDAEARKILRETE